MTTSTINVRPKHATARILRVVNDEVDEIIVADIHAAGVAALVAEDGDGETHHPGLSAIHEVPPPDCTASRTRVVGRRPGTVRGST